MSAISENSDIIAYDFPDEIGDDHTICKNCVTKEELELYIHTEITDNIIIGLGERACERCWCDIAELKSEFLETLDK